MLLHLPHTTNDKQFKSIFDEIKRSLWPERDYFEHVESGVEPKLSEWGKFPVARAANKEIGESTESIVKHVSAKKDLYAVFSGQRKLTDHRHLPFVERYHQYFLKRQWNTPLRDPGRHYKGLFRLHPLADADELKAEVDDTNYSSHECDYCHFLNVVAATARLIDHFSDQANTIGILFKPHHLSTEGSDEEANLLASTLVFDPSDKVRIFRLMLAAYYHDIGKTVVYHRHAMEGATILASHTTTALLEFGDIVSSYVPTWKFERNDLLFIAALVYYHDQFGTLSTGEAGYLRLVEIIDRLKRASSAVGSVNRAEQVKLSKQFLFDLWLLNVADIIVSTGSAANHELELSKGKCECQDEWLTRTRSKEIIKRFFGSYKAKHLEHDLFIALQLLDKHNINWHSDNLQDLQAVALTYADRHVVERINRLIQASLIEEAKRFAFDTAGAPSNCRAKEIFTFLSTIPRHDIDVIILRCLQSAGNLAEFSSRFAWIGQMDYALGFFNKIARRALKRIKDQLCPSQESEGVPQRTGWINDNAIAPGTESRRNQMDAEFIVDNYASTIVHTLEYLLFRGHHDSQIRNIEFEDASSRLTDEKIDRIIGMEGPYRSRRSIEFILQTIFIY